MTTTVHAYYANGGAASFVGLLNLDTPPDSILRMAEVSDLLGHACELLINEPGYTAYGQKDAANWAAINPIAKMPDGQVLHGDVLIIDTL